MASPNPELLQPPRRNNIPNPDDVIPLTPHGRPPFSHYHSSSTLPATPHTPYSPRQPSVSNTFNGGSETRLRPYLSLSPRLLLTFFSPCLLPIMLTIAHMIYNRSSTASLAESLKNQMFAACGGLAKGAASIQTMPRYLAMQTNEEVIRATQASILAIGILLMDSVKIIEVVVNFIVDTYRSLLLCTIELAVRGTLEIVIAAVETITDAITNSLDSIRENIQSDIAGANKIIQSAVNGINHVTSLINVNLSVPEFSIPSLDFLANVTVPTGFEDSLIKLNSSLPTMIELKEKMNAIIDVPFEALIKEINETRIEMASSFNSTLLPVPSLSSLSSNKANDLRNDLCTNLDTSLIDNTAKSLHKLSNIAIGLMFLLLFLIWLALAIWEWRKWKTLKDTVETVEDEWKREKNVDAWRMVAIVEHPILEKYSSSILGRLSPSGRSRTNIRWFLSYLSHPTCLALLFISLLGFLSIQFQLVALDALKAHARENANSTVAASTNSLTAKLNAAAMESSQEYADKYNAAIDAYQKRIDEELFGSWLNTTAVTLNTTLVEFYDDIDQILNTTFGGTILYNPINNFMYCILGSKINNLEKGLTWISEHAHIDLPKLPSNILMLSNETMNEIATPIAASAAESDSGDGADEGIVGKLINHFENALKTERTFYGIMLGMWGLLFFIGLIIVIWNSGGRDKYYQYRGGVPPSSPPNNGNGNNTMTKWIPWMKTDQAHPHPIYDTYAEKQFRGTTPTFQNQDLPRIIEPNNNNSNNPQYDEKSFFEYPNDTVENTRRPFVPRKGTFGLTISSLAAPGQAFLKLAGRKLSQNDINTIDNQDEKRLVEKDINSEKYTNNTNDNNQNHIYSNGHMFSENDFSKPRSSKTNTQMQSDTVVEERKDDDKLKQRQTFWVDKFYGAYEGVKSMFPTRGEKLGHSLGSGLGLGLNKSLKRKESTRTENSFGASQIPTALTQNNDWPSSYYHHHQNQNHDQNRNSSQDNISVIPNEQYERGPEWTMVDPQSIGRALDDDNSNSNYDSRYPPIGDYHKRYSEQMIYPRPMSRAPTLAEGSTMIKTLDPFADNNSTAPPLPPKPQQYTEHDYGHDQSYKHDSVDYLNSDNVHDQQDQDENNNEERLLSVISPSLSSISYFNSEPQLQSVNRINLNLNQEHRGTGTTALASILQELQEKKREQQLYENEGDVFGDNRRIV
ncbi:uncharacterized protein L201_005971 [Kwoniella dendrophila CBS 6074]|uniref:Plasma membrane fusion protein PRM1 n=1 Tax=Kwoniella dendrophila CBS 6074 TaxID=1295534 RepID=A0AAX4JZX1_9TREE